MSVPRLTVLLLVAFAVAYLLFAAIGGVRHGSERAQPSPAPPTIRFDAFAFTPGFAKVSGLLATYAIAGGSSLSITVRPSTQTYRLMRVALRQGGSLAVDHPEPNDVTKTDHDLVASGTSLTLVVGSEPSLVTLTCQGPTPCQVSTR